MGDEAAETFWNHVCNGAYVFFPCERGAGFKLYVIGEIL